MAMVILPLAPRSPGGFALASGCVVTSLVTGCGGSLPLSCVGPPCWASLRTDARSCATSALLVWAPASDDGVRSGCGGLALRLARRGVHVDLDVGPPLLQEEGVPEGEAGIRLHRLEQILHVREALQPHPELPTQPLVQRQPVLPGAAQRGGARLGALGLHQEADL